MGKIPFNKVLLLKKKMDFFKKNFQVSLLSIKPLGLLMVSIQILPGSTLFRFERLLVHFN